MNLDKTFFALANEHRRKIVYELSFRPHSVNQLASKLKMSFPAIHKHIKILVSAKLVQRKKSGRVNYMAINKESLREFQNWIMQFHAYWGSNQETLENYIDNIKRSIK